jgi:hypothetical protein
VNQKCVASYEGMACPDVAYVCLNQKCTSRRLPEDSCSSNEQCEGATKCHRSKCEGFSEGEACTEYTCAYGLYCTEMNSTDVCVPAKAVVG